jgi:phosphohistidine phosphatase
VNPDSRVLVIVRHAKAEPSAATDHERRLTDGGRADAGAAGSWLAGSGVRPDRVLVSSAARTRDTWESLAGGASYVLEAEYDDSLYAAGPETALDLLRETSDEVTTLLVIGHNPTMAFLAQMLEDGEGDAEASTAMAEGFPTTAVAVLEHDGTWAELEMSGARLRAFHVGRG